jgi:transcriptional regulator
VRRTLTAHLARANPHRAADGGGEALVVFTGPDAYVSPGYYPSKGGARPRRADLEL